MQQVIDFISAHQVILAGLIVAILDFIFAISPGLESNGIVHAIYVFLKPKAQP